MCSGTDIVCFPSSRNAARHYIEVRRINSFVWAAPVSLSDTEVTIYVRSYVHIYTRSWAALLFLFGGSFLMPRGHFIFPFLAIPIHIFFSVDWIESDAVLLIVGTIKSCFCALHKIYRFVLSYICYAQGGTIVR